MAGYPQGVEWLAVNRTLLQRSERSNKLLFLKDFNDYRWHLHLRSLRVIIPIPFPAECGLMQCAV